MCKKKIRKQYMQKGYAIKICNKDMQHTYARLECMTMWHKSPRSPKADMPAPEGRPKKSRAGGGVPPKGEALIGKTTRI